MTLHPHRPQVSKKVKKLLFSKTQTDPFSYPRDGVPFAFPFISVPLPRI